MVYYDVLDHILEYTTWPRESYEDQEEGNCLNLICVSGSQSHSSALVSIVKNPLDLAIYTILMPLIFTLNLHFFFSYVLFTYFSLILYYNRQDVISFVGIKNLFS